MKHLTKNGILILLVVIILLGSLVPITFQNSEVAVNTVDAQSLRQRIYFGFNPFAAIKWQIDSALTDALGSLSYLFLTLSGYLLWVAGLFFDYVLGFSVLNMADFLDNTAGIEVAWRVLRDIVNMMFIFALLYIAIATILRIEEYGAKRLLSRIIIIALLINFSLFFTKIIIDASNVLTAEFTDGIKKLSQESVGAWGGAVGILSKADNSVSGAFVEPLRLTSLYGSSGGYFDKVDASETNIKNILSVGIFGSIFVLIAAGIFFAGGLLLAIRFVMFIFLMISSPVAFAGMILPITQSFSRQWWNELFKYAIFAPVYMAFLLATAVVVRDPQFATNLSGGDVESLSGGLVGLLTGNGGQIVVAMNFVIVSGLMIAALVVAQKMGVRGAAAISHMGTKGLAHAGGTAGKFIGRRYNELTEDYILGRGKGTRSALRRGIYTVMNPVAVTRGWGERREELNRLAQSGATARGRMIAEQFVTGPVITSPILSPNQWFFHEGKPGFGAWKQWLSKENWKQGGKLKIDYATMDDRRDENEFMEDYTGMRKESLMHAAVQLEGLEGTEGSLRRRAIVKAAATQGYLDDLLRMKPFAEKYADADGTIYSAKTLNRFLYGYVANGRPDDHTAQRFMAEDMEDLGKRTGHYEYLGHAYFDPTSGEYKRGFDVVKIDGKTTSQGIGDHEVENLKDNWQAKYAAGEIAKVTGRDRVKVAPHNFTALRADVAQGKDGKWHFTEKQKVKQMIDGVEVEVEKDAEELDTSVRFGATGGQLDDFYKSMLGAIDEGDLRELHHSQSRTPNWLLGSEVDLNTGEIIVDDEDDAKKIEAMYREKPEYIRGLYGKKFGMDYKEAKAALPGIKVAYYKPIEWDENKKPTKFEKVQSEVRIGNARGVKHPVVRTLLESFDKDPDLKLNQLDKPIREQIEKALEKHAVEIYEGTFGSKDLAKAMEKEIKGRRDTEKTDWSKQPITIDKLAEGAYSNMQRSLEDNYSPVKTIGRIERDGVEISINKKSKLTTSLNKAYTEHWKNVAEKGGDLSKHQNELRAAFEKAIAEIDEKLLKDIKKVGGISRLIQNVSTTKHRREAPGESPRNPDDGGDDDPMDILRDAQ